MANPNPNPNIKILSYIMDNLSNLFTDSESPSPKEDNLDKVYDTFMCEILDSIYESIKEKEKEKEKESEKFDPLHLFERETYPDPFKSGNSENLGQSRQSGHSTQSSCPKFSSKQPHQPHQLQTPHLHFLYEPVKSPTPENTLDKKVQTILKAFDSLNNTYSGDTKNDHDNKNENKHVNKNTNIPHFFQFPPSSTQQTQQPTQQQTQQQTRTAPPITPSRFMKQSYNPPLFNANNANVNTRHHHPSSSYKNDKVTLERKELDMILEQINKQNSMLQDIVDENIKIRQYLSKCQRCQNV